MAESLVEGILRDAGNQVYRLGYESVLQNLTQVDQIFDRHSEIGEKIRAIPALVEKYLKPTLKNQGDKTR